MDLIQINRWKVGLGLLALFLLVCVPVHGKDKNYGEFYLTVHAYPVDIGSVEVAKELAAICADFLVYPADKNLVADINTLRFLSNCRKAQGFKPFSNK